MQCTGKALAHSANGDLLFVGRSLDSMFDLFSGALAEKTTKIRLVRVPFSFQHRPSQISSTTLGSSAAVTSGQSSRRPA